MSLEIRTNYHPANVKIQKSIGERWEILSSLSYQTWDFKFVKRVKYIYIITHMQSLVF